MYFQLSKTFLSINYIFREKSSYLSNYLLQHLLLLLDQITLISYELKTYYTCTSYLKMHYFGLPSTIIVTNGVKFWIKYPKSLVSHRQKNLILEPFLDPRWPHRLRHAPKPHCRVVHREVHPRLFHRQSQPHRRCHLHPSISQFPTPHFPLPWWAPMWQDHGCMCVAQRHPRVPIRLGTTMGRIL